MGKIDLVTVYHLDDLRYNKENYKYTFKAPANSGIKPDDFVIVKQNKKTESIAKVVTVIPDIDENGELIKSIRAMTSIGTKELKPVEYKLTREKFEYHSKAVQKQIDEHISIEKLDEYLESKNTLSRPERLKNALRPGDSYYSIEEYDTNSMEKVRHNNTKYLLESHLVTYNNTYYDKKKIEEGNVFFDIDQVSRIIDIIGKYSNERRNIKEELEKIM